MDSSNLECHLIYAFLSPRDDESAARTAARSAKPFWRTPQQSHSMLFSGWAAPKLPLPLGASAPLIKYDGFLGPPDPALKRHLDRFSRFRWAHKRPTDRQTMPIRVQQEAASRAIAAMRPNNNHNHNHNHNHNNIFTYLLEPISVENLGAYSSSTLNVLSDLGRRINSGNARETA